MTLRKADSKTLPFWAMEPKENIPEVVRDSKKACTIVHS